jgi:hypothetical protein
MVDETEDPDIAAARLEAALERIAKRAAEKPAVPPVVAAMPEEPYIAELADRLDNLIDRLRGALASK